MKKLVSLLAITVALTLVALPVAYSQQEKTPAPVPRPGQGQAQAEKTFEGQLTRVDPKAQSLWVKGNDDKEMQFRYTDQTQVQGPEKDVQGLAGKTGTPLKITYREAGANNIATRIEVMEKR